MTENPITLMKSCDLANRSRRIKSVALAGLQKKTMNIKQQNWRKKKKIIKHSYAKIQQHSQKKKKKSFEAANTSSHTVLNP